VAALVLARWLRRDASSVFTCRKCHGAENIRVLSDTCVQGRVAEGGGQWTGKDGDLVCSLSADAG